MAEKLDTRVVHAGDEIKDAWVARDKETVKNDDTFFETIVTTFATTFGEDGTGECPKGFAVEAALLNATANYVAIRAGWRPETLKPNETESGNYKTASNRKSDIRNIGRVYPWIPEARELAEEKLGAGKCGFHRTMKLVGFLKTMDVGPAVNKLVKELTAVKEPRTPKSGTERVKETVKALRALAKGDKAPKPNSKAGKALAAMIAAAKEYGI